MTDKETKEKLKKILKQIEDLDESLAKQQTTLEVTKRKIEQI